MKILLMARMGPKVVVETESLDSQEINGITTVYRHQNHSIFFWPTSPQLQPKILSPTSLPFLQKFSIFTIPFWI